MVRPIVLCCMVATGVLHAGLPGAFAARVTRHRPPTATSPAISRPQPSAGRKVIKRASDGLFYVEAEINGARLHFVVDSGASVVVLSAADAARATVRAHDGVDVETAGGRSTMRRASIRQVVVAGRTLTNVDAAIVDNGLPISLLGQSALAQLTSVTFRGDQLVFD